MRATVTPLGAVPGVVEGIVAVVSMAITYGLSWWQASKQAAEQYDYFKDVTDKQLMEAAIQLSRMYPGRMPYWEWNGYLKRLKQYGFIEQPVPGEPIIIPPPTNGGNDAPPPQQAGLTTALIVMGIVAIGFLIIEGGL